LTETKISLYNFFIEDGSFHLSAQEALPL